MGRKKQPDSWRSKGKGDCFTTKGGVVVCEGSKGMNYQKKGREKSTAIGTRVKFRGTTAAQRKESKAGISKTAKQATRYKVIKVKKDKVRLEVTSHPDKAKGKGGKGKTLNVSKEVYHKRFLRE